jgi:hypothetical protein
MRVDMCDSKNMSCHLHLSSTLLRRHTMHRMMKMTITISRAPAIIIAKISLLSLSSEFHHDI